MVYKELFLISVSFCSLKFSIWGSFVDLVNDASVLCRQAFNCCVENNLVLLWFINSFNVKLFQGGQDIISMLGQFMKPKKTEITGKILHKFFYVQLNMLLDFQCCHTLLQDYKVL